MAPRSGYIHDQPARRVTCSRPARPAARSCSGKATRPVVLLSAGVGATPVLAMLHVLAAERSPRPVWWLHGARNGAEHPFAAEVGELLAELPDAHRIVCYSRPNPGDDRLRRHRTAHRGRARRVRRPDRRGRFLRLRPRPVHARPRRRADRARRPARPRRDGGVRARRVHRRPGSSALRSARPTRRRAMPAPAPRSRSAAATCR